MSYCYICIIMMGVVISCGCVRHTQSEESIARSMVGKWESGVEPGEWGRSITQLEFSRNGKVTFRAVFIDESPPKELAYEGNYGIVDSKLISDAINKGKPLGVWFDRNDLMLQIDDEPPGRYHRVYENPQQNNQTGKGG